MIADYFDKASQEQNKSRLNNNHGNVITNTSLGLTLSLIVQYFTHYAPFFQA